MVDETLLAELRAAKSAWRTVSRKGYLLTFPTDAPSGPHTMAGSHTIRGGDCPNCDKPLLRLLTLETAKMPFGLGLQQPPLIHLFYCWTCAIPYGPLAYRIEPDGGVRLLNYKKQDDGAFGPAGPYDGYTGQYPEVRIGLRALTDDEEERALLARRGDSSASELDLSEPVHQVGGFPMIWNDEEPDCPVCAVPSPFLATICDNAEGQEFQRDKTKTFTNNCGVQMVFHYCARCSVVTAYHSCD